MAVRPKQKHITEPKSGVKIVPHNHPRKGPRFRVIGKGNRLYGSYRELEMAIRRMRVVERSQKEKS